ncbi:MAG: imidazolonepropionase [Nocardioidaceae bacterium]|nr:imidazolonepropionase [Nocardioidaceae bacterium]
MSSVLVTNVGELTTNDSTLGDGSMLGLIHDAALVIENGQVSWVGDRRLAPPADRAIDAGDAAVIPGFVDSHSHLVFAGDRAAEFAARMTGHPYAAGGIRTTVSATRAATDETLSINVAHLVDEMLRQGTTTVEIKSGYGLTVADELRSLAIARQFTEETTFLGAHVVPPEFVDDPAGYVELVTGSMLEAAAPYARWVDVFCERGAFDGDQARAILQAGMAAGLLPRVHANQLGPGPGVQIACEMGAASADHCTHLSKQDIEALSSSGVVATLLPAVEFSTRSVYPDARALLAAGVTVALASDCNPGSCYSSSMPLCIALAVREMRMSPGEALWAATCGGATALRRDDVGHLGVGAKGDFAVLAAPSYLHLAYRPGVPLISSAYAAGRRVA